MTNDQSGAAAVLPLGPPFEADETVRSWMARAAALHGLSFEVVLRIARQQSPLFAPQVPLDFSIPAKWARNLESAAGLAEGTIKPISTRQQRRHRARNVGYCPLCFESDLARNVLPYRRQVWSLCGLSGCPVHECPLFDWEICDPEGNWIYPQEWCDQVSQLDTNNPGFIRLDDPSRRKELSTRQSFIKPEDNATADAYDFVEAYLAAARRLSYVLTPGATPIGADRVDPVVRLEWAAQLTFELELTGLRRPKNSVMKLLGPGNWEHFVGDLYSILATRFWEPGAANRELAVIVDWFLGTPELFAKWPVGPGWGFYHPREFRPSSWQYPPKEASRRLALNAIRCGLENYFGLDPPRTACETFLGHLEKPEKIGYYHNHTSAFIKDFGSYLIHYGARLSGRQESEWFRERLASWPPMIRADAEPRLRQIHRDG